MARRLVILFAWVAALISPQTFGWNDEGHMVVAQIAWERLTPQVRARVDKVVAVRPEPAYLSSGSGGRTINLAARTSTFLTLACWADDVKDRLPRTEDDDGGWHYYDQFFSDNGTPVPPPPPPEGPPPAPTNVVAAISRALAVLQPPAPPPGGPAGKPPRVSYATLKLQSAPLRYVVHFVGDIHQPLHCASRVSAQHPGGDEGGLKFAVARTYGQKHLHGLWDQGGRLFRLNMPRPLTAYGYSLIQTLARDIMETYPATNFVAQLAETSVAAWANEGFDLAKTNVYVGVQPGGAPSSDYLHKLETTASRQVALAGYRLAALLNEIFK